MGKKKIRVDETGSLILFHNRVFIYLWDMTNSTYVEIGSNIFGLANVRKQSTYLHCSFLNSDLCVFLLLVEGSVSVAVVYI